MMGHALEEQQGGGVDDVGGLEPGELVERLVIESLAATASARNRSADCAAGVAEYLRP